MSHTDKTTPDATGTIYTPPDRPLSARAVRDERLQTVIAAEHADWRRRQLSTHSKQPGMTGLASRRRALSHAGNLNLPDDWGSARFAGEL